MKASSYLRTLLLAAVVLALPAASFAGVFISVGIAPPPLPVYAQPVIPASGYLWTPGSGDGAKVVAITGYQAPGCSRRK